MTDSGKRSPAEGGQGSKVQQRLARRSTNYTKATVLEHDRNVNEAAKAAVHEHGMDKPPAVVEPVDIFGTFEPPPFDCSLLPDPLGRMAADQGMLIGCDPGIIGMAGLAVLAGAIDDRIQIQPKRMDPTWRESARVWVATIGDPSAKKSPALSKAVAPIKSVAAELRREHARAVKAWEEACKQLKKSDKKPPYPHCRRLTISDTTTEKLADILGHPEAEPRGILGIYDELSGHLTGMDCYKNGGHKDKAKWLEAYNGGSTEIDRVRGSTWVENWSVSIVGGIQPEVIHAYANTTNHDGMLQRFLLYKARPASAGVDQHPDMAAINDYSTLVRNLIDLSPDCTVVKLSEAAHAIREQFTRKILRFAQSTPNRPLSAMLGKWEGTFARLLLIFHLCECMDARKHPTTVKVSGEAAQRVARLMLELLLPHAISFYSGLDTTGDNAHRLASLILAKQWSRFTVKRDLTQQLTEFRHMKPYQQDLMLDRLEAYSWIWPESGKVNERGRPVAFSVNPRVHELFEQHAARERQRRSDVSKVINEMKAAHRAANVEDVAHARGAVQR